MAIKTFVSGEILTASDTNAYLNNGGLVYVASKTFASTSAAQQIDNCFTSTYDYYRVLYSGKGNQTSSQLLNFRFVDGTTPFTTGVYYYGRIQSATGAAPTGQWNGPTGLWQVGLVGDSWSHCQFDVFSPNLATASKTFVANWHSSATADATFGQTSGWCNTTTTMEGLQMYPTTGNWEGTITVFGYRKA